MPGALIFQSEVSIGSGGGEKTELDEDSKLIIEFNK